MIYPLTVAAKSSVAQRRDAALHILNNMKEHSPNLVNQALLVIDIPSQTLQTSFDCYTGKALKAGVVSYETCADNSKQGIKLAKHL